MQQSICDRTVLCCPVRKGIKIRSQNTDESWAICYSQKSGRDDLQCDKNGMALTEENRKAIMNIVHIEVIG